MNLLLISSYLFIIVWIVQLLFFFWKKKCMNVAMHATWLPILLLLFYYCQMFFYKNDFPIQNFEQFSIIVLFLVIILLNILYWYEKALTYIVQLFILPILIIVLLLTKEINFVAEFSYYSNWLLFFHIFLVALGQVFFTFSFLGASYMLILRWMKKTPTTLLVKRIQRFINYVVIAGLFFFSVGGLIGGMAWANIAWGKFWSWDPKETWALLTFIIYTIYIHRIKGEEKDTGNNLYLFFSFIFLMFNFIYINFFISGLHSYTLIVETYFTKL